MPLFDVVGKIAFTLAQTGATALNVGTIIGCTDVIVFVVVTEQPSALVKVNDIIPGSVNQVISTLDKLFAPFIPPIPPVTVHKALCPDAKLIELFVSGLEVVQAVLLPNIVGAINEVIETVVVVIKILVLLYKLTV